VVVFELKRESVYEKIYYGGRILPNSIITIYSPLNGIIRDVYVVEQDKVKIGDKLLSIIRKTASEDYLPTIVYSPINGVISKINVASKNEVFDRSELLQIADISKYRIDLLVSDNDIVKLKRGDIAFIKGTDIQGIVKSIGLISENNTGLFKVSIEFFPAKEIFPGKFVEIELRVDNYTGFLLPIDLIVQRYGKNLVYIVKDNKVIFQEVVIGKRYDKQVVIEKGLNENDLIITKYNKVLYEGDAVKVKIEDKIKSNLKREERGGFGGNNPFGGRR